MNSAEEAFLDQLLNTPGTSGYEEMIQEVVREYAETFADDVSTDWHGNVTVRCGTNESRRVMLAGHCDQIGLVVKHIDDKGFLRAGPVGGWDVQTLIGQAMDVWTNSGGVPGVIARKAIHLLSQDERKQVPEVKDLWVDIGANDKADAEEVVSIGDPVTLRLGPRKMRNGFLSGPAMDDRVGVWVAIQAARRAKEQGCEASVFAVSTVQEEIGLRGARTSAYRIDPHVAIAIDVTHATDTPTVDPNELGDIRLGAGPVVFRGANVNSVLFERLTSGASEQDIPYQVAALNRPASNDANALQLTRGGPATGVIGIPNRYMHSPVEMISPADLDAAANLLAEFCTSLESDSDFTP
ncbi:M42 family metallopeptidase [Stratiformator vulcanicus]|uniref:Aminopeptidase YsdC n=1 Tax=Stratiformator vulcanicus TaxID=2527980 RepID=A0A517QYV8_9PLAN|nr:M42 family metallopeptidase [Stratiformator vulcanicus]QDT36788.1 Putative aminopeptidase YsdC [Stratiformator vulcanicus]